jgi:hypothetical protein
MTVVPFTVLFVGVILVERKVKKGKEKEFLKQLVEPLDKFNLLNH